MNASLNVFLNVYVHHLFHWTNRRHAFILIQVITIKMFGLKHLRLRACLFAHVPACVFTPAALEQYRECQEAVEAAAA